MGKRIKELRYIFTDTLYTHTCVYILLIKWAESSEDKRRKKHPFWCLHSLGKCSLLSCQQRTETSSPHQPQGLTWGSGAARFPLSKSQEKHFMLPSLEKKAPGQEHRLSCRHRSLFSKHTEECQVWGCQVPDFRVHSVTAYKFLWCAFGTTCYPRLIICSQIAESV